MCIERVHKQFFETMAWVVVIIVIVYFSRLNVSQPRCDRPQRIFYSTNRCSTNKRTNTRTAHSEHTTNSLGCSNTPPPTESKYTLHEYLLQYIQYSHHQTNFRVRNKDIPIGTHHTLTYTHARPVYLLCVCGRCECGSIHLQSQFKRLPRNKKSELLQFIGFNSTTNSLHA